MVCSRYNSVWEPVQYRGNSTIGCFVDSNLVGDPDDQNYTIGYVFTHGLGPITWVYKKQSALFLSSKEA